jgi:hypothetical protein
VIEPDKTITIDNPNAIKALDTARSWIGTISPEGVSTYAEEEARNIWQAGHAAFMGNWPFCSACATATSRSLKSPLLGDCFCNYRAKCIDHGPKFCHEILWKRSGEFDLN